jgi:hypothetical protein
LEKIKSAPEPAYVPASGGAEMIAEQCRQGGKQGLKSLIT